MSSSVKVVNQIHIACLDTKVNLPNLYEKLVKHYDAKLYSQRPRMLRIRYEQLTILIFGTGKVRFMGKPREEYELVLLFSKLTDMDLTCMKLINETVTFQLDIPYPVNLLKYAHTYPHIFTFEPELFIGMHISYFKHVHVNMFSTGKVVILGRDAQTTAQQVIDLFHSLSIL